MRVIHTSDWHLGQRMRQYERRDEHACFIEQLCKIAREEKPDALIVSGDIFDTAIPTIDVQKDFIEYVMRLRDAYSQMKIVITAGNHDSGQRLNIHRPLWDALNETVIGSCQRDEQGLCDCQEFIVDINGKGVVAAVPYFHPRNFPLIDPDCEPDKRQREFFAAVTKAARAVAGDRPMVLMAHLAVEGCDFACHKMTTIGGMDTQQADELGSDYDYLALGHIHHPQTLKDGPAAIRYCGSPIPMSFAEDFDHSVTIVEIAKAGSAPTITPRHITPLRAIKTIQPENGMLDDAFAILASMGQDDDAYLRILISDKSPYDPNALHRAAVLLEGKKARLCSIERVKDETEDEAPERKTINVEEFKAMDPLDVAMLTYRKVRKEDMPAELIEMMKSAIAETSNL